MMLMINSVAGMMLVVVVMMWMGMVMMVVMMVREKVTVPSIMDDGVLVAAVGRKHHERWPLLPSFFYKKTS